MKSKFCLHSGNMFVLAAVDVHVFCLKFCGMMIAGCFAVRASIKGIWGFPVGVVLSYRLARWTFFFFRELHDGP